MEVRMKTFIILFIISLIAIIQAVSYHRRCNKQTDCSKSECCESHVQPRGKRDLRRLAPGVCKPRLKVQQSCVYKFLVPQPTDGTWLRCPCAGGLVCKSNSLREEPIGVLGNCVRKVPLQRKCNNRYDCARSECCVSNVRPIGKRDTKSFIGTCSALGKEGSDCLVRNNNHLPKPGPVFVSCPCFYGFTCVGTGVFDIPLGEVGKCKPKPPPTRNCNTPSDCRKGECCVSNVRPKGKRDTKSFIGTCKPLGKENENCLVRNNKPLPKPGAVFVSCPCSRGLTCAGTGVFDIPLGEMGKCKRKIPPTRNCNTPSDCRKGECCVSKVRPIGKRDIKSFIGTCKPLGKENESCLVRNNKPLPRPGAVFVSCPCGRGLTCVGSGISDIPLGEVGKCKRRIRYW